MSRDWLLSVLTVVAAVLLPTSCGAPPARQSQAKTDPARDPGYTHTAEQVAEIASNAEAAFKAGNSEEAAKLVQQGQPLMARLLDVGQPTLPAMRAVSDLDDLYARMLLGNRHYGWARMLFQKNVARWKTWPEQTEETARRRKQAETGIADCDRKMAQ